MFVEREKTASFDVDPQRGFTPLCPKELPIAGGDEIAGELNEQANYSTCRVVRRRVPLAQRRAILSSASHCPGVQTPPGTRARIMNW